MKRAAKGALAVVVILIVAVVLLWCFTGKDETPEAIEKPAATAPKPQGEGMRQTAEASVSEEDDIDLEKATEVILEAVEEITDKIKPVVWQQPDYSDLPKNLSGEDLETAKRLLSRFSENFSKIVSLSLHHEQKLTAVVDREYTRNALERPGGFSYRVEYAASPFYFKMQGTYEGEDFKEIITPAGKISSGQVGRGASWIPQYNSGAFCFNLGTSYVLAEADSLEEDVAFTMNPPGLEEYAKRATDKAALYDVIVDYRKQAVVGGDLLTKFWINKKTGMVDFVTDERIPPKDDNIFYSATAYEYEKTGEVYYLKKRVLFTKDCRLKFEDSYTDISITTGPAE